MELDRLAVELRRRNGFESLDLGLAMLQAWRRPVMAAWCATFWPFAIVVSALLWEHPAIAYAIVWWSKPFFDRVLLHVYGAAMFGAPPALRDTLREVPRLLRRTGLLPALTLWRLSMARSLFQPVAQLEGQRGAAARARRRVLGARGYGYAAWLTFFCANLVGIWGLSALVVLLELLPVESVQGFGLANLLFDEPEWVGLRHATNAFFFLADTLIEPYFVAAGFSLYLNRRSELEGWDIEVAFRRMARRRAGASATAAIAASIGALCIGLALLGAPADAAAADLATSSASGARAGDPLPYPKGAIKGEVARVLEDPVFGRKETRTRWVPRPSEDKSKGPEWLAAWLKRIARAMEALARAGRVLVWIAVALALAAALYVLIRYRERWLPARRARAIPQTLFGLDVRPESLPADIAAAARAALAAGDVAGALGLLYRGALSALVNFAAVDFRPGDTERDCWRRATPALSGAGAQYFRALLDAWLRTAYAHRPPPTDDLARLCDDWGRHFQPASLARAPA